MNDQESETNWYAKRGDRVIGPVPFNKLQELARSVGLKANDQVRRSSESNWQPASDILRFEVQRTPQPPEPPPISTAVPHAEIAQSKAQPFIEWYRHRWVYSLRWFFQLPIWLIYGFVWIPIWYVLSATPAGGLRTRWESLSFSGKAVACLPLLIFPVLNLGSSRRPSSENLSDVELVSDSDFANVGYSFEFDESEYGKIPAGATPLVEEESVEVSKADDDYMRGTWLETSGYRTSDGQFVSHGVQRSWDNERKGRLLVERNFLHGALHGKTTQWDPQGECIGNKLYVNGVFHGRQWSKFDSRTEVESFWRNGKRHGYRRETWPSGKLFSEKWFVNDVIRSPYSEFFEDGKPSNRQMYDEDGNLHGTQLFWGSPSHPEPHHISYLHGVLHGDKIMRGRKGEVILQSVYEKGKVITPMHPAGSSIGSEVLWDLLHIADTAKWLRNPELAKKPKAPINRESLEELFGPPLQKDNLGIADISVHAYQCSDGILFFQIRPAGETLMLDLLTSDAIAQFLSEPWGDELSDSHLFKMVLGSVLTTDRYAAEAALRAKNE